MKTTEEWAKEFAANVNKEDLWEAYYFDSDTLGVEMISPEILLKKLESINVSYDIPGECKRWLWIDEETDKTNCGWKPVAIPIVVLYDDRYASIIDYVDDCIVMGKNFYNASLDYISTFTIYEEYENYNKYLFDILGSRIDFDLKDVDIYYNWDWVKHPGEEASKLVQEI